MLPIGTVRFGLAWSRLRLRLRLCLRLCLLLRLQVNNVNNESLACSSVWQHFRQAQETRQQRLEWRDLNPCVCVWQSRPFEGRTLFLFFRLLFWEATLCTLGNKKARQKADFQLHLMRAERFMAKCFDLSQVKLGFVSLRFWFTIWKELAASFFRKFPFLIDVLSLFKTLNNKLLC